MNKVLFIPAAGMGSRLGEMTANTPKALVKYKGEPLIESVLRKAESAGFTQAVVNVHHFADQLEAYIKQRNNRQSSIKCVLSDERAELKNTGGALTHALSLLEPFDYVMVHNVDVFSNLDLKKLCSDFEQNKYDACLVVQRRETERFMLFEPSGLRLKAWYNSKISKLRIPKQTEIASEIVSETDKEQVNNFVKSSEVLAFNGVHCLRTELIRDWAEKYGNAPFSVIDSYLLSSNKYNIVAYKPNEPYFWRDMGKIPSFESDFPEII